MILPTCIWPCLVSVFYYPPKVRSMKYCRLGVFMGQYSFLADSFTIGHFKCINSEYIWVVKIRNTSEAVLGPKYTPWPPYWLRTYGPWSEWWPWGVLWPSYCLLCVSYIIPIHFPLVTNPMLPDTALMGTTWREQHPDVYAIWGSHLANQISRKLGVFDRKLEGNHSILHCYSDNIRNKEAISSKFSIFQSIKLTRYQEDFPLSLHWRTRSHSRNQHGGTRLGLIS